MNEKLKKIFAGVSQTYELDTEESDENLFDIFVNSFNNSYSVDHVNTLALNKRGYGRFEKLMENKLDTPDYSFHCSYDVSGYDYWKNTMKESNYIVIVVKVNNENMDMEKFESDLHDFICKIQSGYADILKKSYMIKSYYEGEEE